MGESAYVVLRWVHILCGSAWFGEVVVINFVLIPVVNKLDLQTRRAFIKNVFPRIFRLASILAATTVIAGALLMWHYVGGDLRLLLKSRWGHGILVGGTLGTLLTLFHFFMEERLAKKIGIGADGSSPDADAALEDVHTKLKIVPRLGLAVITTIMISMMFAVRSA